MYKLVAVILVISAAVTCAPDRTKEDLDTILDAVFGSSTPAQPTSQPITASDGGVTCAPDKTTEDLDSIFDAVFGSSTPAQPTSQPTTASNGGVTCAPDKTTKDLDSILDAVFGSSTPAQPTSKTTTASDGGLENQPSVKECAVGGEKATCVPYYLCPERDHQIDPIVVLDEEDCPHYLEVCCLAPKTLDDIKDST